jgi:spore coat-associated protein N
MSRMTSLWKASPRKVLLAFGGLMPAAALAVGSGANVNSTIANPSNVFTAGTISQSNSKAGAAILTASNIVPGNSATGTVDIKNTRSASGTFTLTHTTPVDTPASPALSGKLTMTIVDQTDPTCATTTPVCAGTTLYTGTIAGQPASIALGAFPAGTTHRYLYTMTFPSAHRPPTTPTRVARRPSSTTSPPPAKQSH